MNYLSIEFADTMAENDFRDYCAREGKGLRVPVHPERIAEVLWDIPTIFLDKGTFKGDEIAYADFEQKRIVVECCGYEPRERFSTAHETGHFSLHRYLSELGELYDRYELQREKQADAYASALLMPKSILLPFIEKNSGLLSTPQYLVAMTKQHFHVSEPAARIRLENVGVISSPQRASHAVKQYEATMDDSRQSWSQERW